MNVIVDYGLGNIRSLINWFSRAGEDIIISNDPEVIERADLLILPGVGAYRDAMASLVKGKFDDMIKTHVAKNKPLVGICLGMQLLYDQSFEGGRYKGLGLLKGDVVPFNSSKVKVPHMGWNNLTSKIEFLEASYVYFVHSYYVDGDEKDVLAYTTYDMKVPGVVRKDNVMGFQFHPEKSGAVGREILSYIKEFKSEYISSN